MYEIVEVDCSFCHRKDQQTFSLITLTKYRHLTVVFTNEIVFEDVQIMILELKHNAGHTFILFVFYFYIVSV